MLKLIVAVLTAMVLAGCGADDGDDPDGERPAIDPGQQALEPPEADLPLAEIRRARGAVRVIERQAANVAGATLSREDLLPSTRGAELLIERGHIDEEQFCDALGVVIQVDARDTDADLHAAAERFGSVWQDAAPDDVAALGATVFNGLFVHCI